MGQEKFSNEMPEQVLLIPKPRRIRIDCTQSQRAYGLFDSKTGTQVRDFVKCNGGQIEFDNLDPNMHYDVGVIENMGDKKPYFAMIWTLKMRDDTDLILSNSGNLPVEYPYVYYVIDKDKSGNNRIFNLGDDKKEVVAQVTELTHGDDKLEFVGICSFKMVDDTKK